MQNISEAARGRSVGILSGALNKIADPLLGLYMSDETSLAKIPDEERVGYLPHYGLASGTKNKRNAGLDILSAFDMTYEEVFGRLPTRTQVISNFVHGFTDLGLRKIIDNPALHLLAVSLILCFAAEDGKKKETHIQYYYLDTETEDSDYHRRLDHKK